MLTLANKLTLTRLAILPVIVLLLFIPAQWAALSALVLYTIGAITDWLDGWVARKWNQYSEFGRFLDPIADKIFVVVILLTLVAIDRVQGIWVIAIILILIREFLIAGLREFLGPKGITVPVSPLAKWKTAIQLVATGTLIVGPYILCGVTVLGLIGLAAAAILTVMTGWGYIKTGLLHIKD
jgi:cardiolipin synthase